MFPEWNLKLAEAIWTVERVFLFFIVVFFFYNLLAVQFQQARSHCSIRLPLVCSPAVVALPPQALMSCVCFAMFFFPPPIISAWKSQKIRCFSSTHTSPSAPTPILQSHRGPRPLAPLPLPSFWSSSSAFAWFQALCLCHMIGGFDNCRNEQVLSCSFKSGWRVHACTRTYTECTFQAKAALHRVHSGSQTEYISFATRAYSPRWLLPQTPGCLVGIFISFVANGVCVLC